MTFCKCCKILESGLVTSVPVQVIAWKDSSPKWPIMCRAGHKTLLTHYDSSDHLGFVCFYLRL